MADNKDDRVFLSTRIISACVLPVVLLAVLVLYFFPETSAQRFAWEITPDMTAIFIGAGYLGGAYFFASVALARRWHTVSNGFPGVAAFTAFMLLATLLHWSRFDLHHFPFQLWLALYIVTPLLVPWIWLHNRRTDPKKPELDDAAVPALVRLAVRALGVVTMALVIVEFIDPAPLIRVWPWALTTLTARVLCGWFALLGVGEFFISFEDRWSAWRVTLGSIGVWGLFLFAGGFLHPQDFKTGIANWFSLVLLFSLLATAGLFAVMEIRRRKVPAGVTGSAGDTA